MSDPMAAKTTHGHTILHWLAAQPMSREALQQRVDNELGAAALFHTCDSTGLTLDALLALLAGRGKIVPAGAAWTSDLSKMCGDA